MWFEERIAARTAENLKTYEVPEMDYMDVLGKAQHNEEIEVRHRVWTSWGD